LSTGLRPAPAVLRILAAAVWAFSLSAYAGDLPAGKGRDLLKKSCTQCHDLDLVTQQHHSRADWKKVVASMREMGAEATEAEAGLMVDYLTLNFPAETSSVKSKPPVALKAVPWEKNPLKIGLALYRENCAVCHDVDHEETRKLGPSFYHLFQRDKMPKSSGKPDRSYIAARVRGGGPLMPAFAGRLTDAEIYSLIDYLASK